MCGELKQSIKRFGAVLLAVVLLLALFPTSAYAVGDVVPEGEFEYSMYLDVSATNSNDATTGALKMEGNKLTATANGYASSGCSSEDLPSTTTVSLTARVAIESISYTTSGMSPDSANVPSGSGMAAGDVLKFTVTSEAGEGKSASGSITITGVTIPTASYTTTFAEAANGTYTVTYNGATIAAPGSNTALNDVPYILTATPAAGYALSGWTNGTEILSAANPFSFQPTSDGTIYPIFAPSDCAQYRVGDSYYDYLDQAITAAGTSGTIIVVKDGAVYGSAGQTTFTIAKNVKLLVPKSAGDTGNFTETADPETAAPTKYRTLTLHSGTTIECNGAISVSGGQNRTSGGTATALEKGPYGQIQLDEGAVLNMNNGSNLYCYGYVTGAGTVNLKSGANLYELMQVMDWRGGTCSKNTVDGHGLFPMNQFFIQNVESRLNMYPGSAGNVSIGVKVQIVGEVSTSLQYFGSSGLFNLSGGVLTRQMKGSRMEYEVTDGTLTISSIKVSMSGVNLSSDSCILGIPSNLTFIANDGATINMTKSVAALPSTQIVVREGATANISGDIYLIDYAVWKGNNYANSGDYYPLPYSCTNGSNGTKLSTLTSSQLQVDGTLNVQSGGGIFTTTGKNSADVGITGTGVINIASTKAAPKYALTAAKGTEYDSTEIPTAPALITFAGQSASATDLKSYATGNHVYYGTSASHTAANWYEYLVTVKDGTAGVVPGAAPTAGADYATVTRGGQTFQNVVGYAVSGGTFSFTVNASSVSAVKANGTALTPDANGVYTVTVTGDTELEIERAATYTVTWLNADGTVLKTDENIAAGTMPKYTGATPTKADDTAAKVRYVFAGWDKTLAPVTGDVTYTATYTEAPLYYAVELYYDDASEPVYTKPETLYKNSLKLTAENPRNDGKQFSYWSIQYFDAQGNALGEAVQYPATQITVHPGVGGITVRARAIYGDETFEAKPFIKIIGAEFNPLTNKWSFTLTQSVPSGNASAVGFVMSTTNQMPELGGAGVIPTTSGKTLPTSTFTAHVSMDDWEGQTLYVRAYLTYNNVTWYSEDAVAYPYPGA